MRVCISTIYAYEDVRLISPTCLISKISGHLLEMAAGRLALPCLAVSAAELPMHSFFFSFSLSLQQDGQQCSVAHSSCSLHSTTAYLAWAMLLQRQPGKARQGGQQPFPVNDQKFSKCLHKLLKWRKFGVTRLILGF